MQTIDNYNFAGKKAIVRVDFNVPLDENGKVTDDTRIRGALPTLKKILADGGSLIIMSHMGKPKGKVNAKFSLGQIKEVVAEKLGVEVQFAPDCAKAAEAAAAAGKKVIGVDTDQAGQIDGTYGAGLTVTSAMKGLYNTTYNTLTDIVVNGNWAKYSGKIEALGLTSGTDFSANYVGLPVESTQWNDGFTQADYEAMVKGMFDGTIKVSDDITAIPATVNTTVEDLGNIK